jgi:hypothetical protein
MKNIIEVLRLKEQELQQIQGEVEALRTAIKLVSEDGENLSGDGYNHAHALAPTGTSSESRVQEISAGSAARRQFP